jgi:hypothetical protein
MEFSRNQWLSAPRGATFTITNWSNMREGSFVVISACESAGGTASIPNKFRGDAFPIVAGCINPQDGSVQFTLWWFGNFPTLNIWTDTILLR